MRSLLPLLPLLAASVLAGCAAPSSYAGISLKPGAVDPQLQELARRARAGDKHAQLDLGIRYEEGRGIEPDLAIAKRLYRAAASPRRERSLIYFPPPRPGAAGRVLPVRSGVSEPGLAEAAQRLAGLK
jgi:hypothetical protein